MTGVVQRPSGASTWRAFAVHFQAPALRRVMLPLLTGLAYYLGALLGVAASAMSEGISIFWLPNGVLLAALLMTRRPEWPGYLLAAVLAEIAADLPTFTLAQALGFAAVNLFECALAAVLLQRVAYPFALDRLRHVGLFGGYALVVACGLAALLGALVYSLTVSTPTSFWAFWVIWWLGDGLGVLLVTPLLLGWLRGVQSSVPGGRVEAVAVFALTLALALTIFLQDPTPAEESTRRPFLLMAASLWAAVRFGVRGASTIGLLIAGVSIAATLGGHGPFVTSTPQRSVLLVQEFLAVQLLSTLLLAALLQELRDRTDRLHVRERALEAISEGVAIVDMRSPGLPLVFANAVYQAAAGNAIRAFVRACRLPDRSADKAEMAELCKALQEGRPGRAMSRDVRADGSEVWEEVIVSPVADASGCVTHYVLVEHDMTAVKQNEAQLCASHEALDQMNRELEARVQERTRELERANRLLEELASVDPLTGASNRRHLLQQARVEISRAQRQHAALSVIMFDVDFFKAVNDEYGHEAGDRVLVELAATVRGVLRTADIFARLGGEEFLLMLPGQGIEQACAVAERLRARVESMEIPGYPMHIRISLGVAGLENEADDVDALLRRVDQALYAAKHQGRNRVCIAGRDTADASAE